MDPKRAIASAKEIIGSLPLSILRKEGLKIDRVNENPEAYRYFLMYGDWNKVSAHEIFRDFDKDKALSTKVYLDFPYCSKLCNFCIFYGVVPDDRAEIKDYLESLKKEVALVRDLYFKQGARADSLNYGGGTPTFLPIELLRDITEYVQEELPFCQDIEFNVEASPETIVKEEGMEKLRYLKERGVNRLSIGVQSFEDAVLKEACRGHNCAQTRQAIENVKKAGFERVNFDLMLGLYGQKIEGFLETVKEAVGHGAQIMELYTLHYFESRDFVPLKSKLENGDGFLGAQELLIARLAADLIARDAGYTSTDGRTYFIPRGADSFYSDYTRGNFRAENIIGLGRKGNSNIYPWQYANYLKIDKYQDALNQGRLPVAAGIKMDSRALIAKLLSGAYQLSETIDYAVFKERFPDDQMRLFGQLMEKFTVLGMFKKNGDIYEKTLLGFLFTEEALKAIYNLAATPFDSESVFLGKRPGGGKR